jgi:predicted nuclease of predicted toxin-antitoxin system
MRIFCDENIMAETVRFLRSLGHDVSCVAEENLSGAEDAVVLAKATKEGRALLTYDADFSDLRTTSRTSHAGIIRLRLRDQTAEAVHPILGHGLRLLSEKDIRRKLVTVSHRSIRIRGHL